LEYWSVGVLAKGMAFIINTPMLQYSNTPTLQYDAIGGKPNA
jgi:hypothetical protein